MEINRSEQNGILVVALSGEVDLESSPDVRKELLACVAEGKGVVVSLADVSYIDSSGIASLVEAFQNARKGNQGFALTDVSDSARRVLELARLDKVFVIHDSLAQSLEEFAS